MVRTRWFWGSLCLLFALQGSAQRVPAEDLVGRLLLLAFTGDSAPLEQLTEFNPAGFLFYRSNLTSTETIRNTTRALSAATDHPLLFGVDQEGGPFNAYRVDDATLFPGNMALAATGDPDLARAVGEAVGNELAYAGLNFNFAPVVDVNSNPDNPIIGIRSFGADPGVVARFGVAYLEGLGSAGVAGVAKHFPGHGDTSQDSHLTLPVVTVDRSRLDTLELAPFRAMIGAGVPAVMTAHVVFVALEADVPATLSSAALTDLLRDELDFNGLVVTDFMDMAAIADNYGAGEAAVRSVQAGADLVLLGPDVNKQRAVYAALREAVRTGRLSSERVRAAVAASEAVARRYPSQDTAAVPDSAAHKELAVEVATKAVTLLLNDDVLPLAEQAVLVLAPRPTRYGEPPALGEVVGRHLGGVRHMTVAEDPTAEEIAEALAAAESADVLVLGTYHWQGDFPEGMAVLESQLVASGIPVIIVALGNPDDLRFLSGGAAAYLAVYGFWEANLEGAARVLTGQVAPRGKLPVGVSDDFLPGFGLNTF